MFLGFAVENYKSFNDIIEFSMISSSKFKDHEFHRYNLHDVNILKNAVIYGANASGKSNMIKAISFLFATLNNGLPLGSINDYCKLNSKNKGRKSTFDLKFSFEEKFYSYGFSAYLNKGVIADEWLYELGTSGAKKIIFEKGDGIFHINNLIKMDSKEKNRIEVYAQDAKEQQDKLFLSLLCRNKNYDKKSGFRLILNLYKNLIEEFSFIFPESRFTNSLVLFDDVTIAEISKLISSFDTGIDSIKTRDVNIEELENKVSPEYLRDKIETSISRMKARNAKKASAILISNDDYYQLTFEINKEPLIKTFCIKHKNSSVYNFTFAEESDGTKRLFDLIPMLLKGYGNSVFFVDELERSLHPKLTIRFVELFNEIHKDDASQLIFTTHETNLFNNNYFRKDEFWFIDKKPNNSSFAFPFSNFINRDALNLDRKYLNGRYGAIPLFQYLEEEDQFGSDTSK